MVVMVADGGIGALYRFYRTLLAAPPAVRVPLRIIASTQLLDGSFGNHVTGISLPSSSSSPHPDSQSGEPGPGATKLAIGSPDRHPRAPPRHTTAWHPPV